MHNWQARAAILAAQEALKSAERLQKMSSTEPKPIYESEEEFQARLKERGINPDATKNPAVRTLNDILGIWSVKKGLEKKPGGMWTEQELLEHRPKIVAVDMDGTILHSKESEKLGDPIPGVREKLDRLKTLGWVVVIWSVRAESPEIIAHLKKHEIPFDYFNWHPWQPKGTSVKIRADVYIDDRAITFSGDAKDYDQVTVHRPWWKKQKDA